MEMIVVHAALYCEWTMIPWFMIQTNMNRNSDDHHVLTPTVLLDSGSMVHEVDKTQIEMVLIISHGDPLLRTYFTGEWFHGL